jgi:hypothetical protein
MESVRLRTPGNAYQGFLAQGYPFVAYLVTVYYRLGL